MLKYTDYDIVFQEIPDQVTLAINLSCCPNGCPGCHSPQLQTNIGELLTKEAMEHLLTRYGDDITCVCLMGGDNDLQGVTHIAACIRAWHPTLHTAWYSGREKLPDDFPLHLFDYLKLGPYVESLGGLRSATTNQRLYALQSNGSRVDLTHRLQS